MTLDGRVWALGLEQSRPGGRRDDETIAAHRLLTFIANNIGDQSADHYAATGRNQLVNETAAASFSVSRVWTGHSSLPMVFQLERHQRDGESDGDKSDALDYECDEHECRVLSRHRHE